MATIGFLGAGEMGFPMVERLVAAGHAVTVHHRAEPQAEAIRAAGATPVRDLNEIARGADAVVVCLFDGQQVRDLLLAPGGLMEAVEPGAVVILHTTSGPGLSEELETRAAARSAYYVDAPVSGGPGDISAGAITLFVGGSDDAWTKAQGILAAYGDPVLHLGPVGTGMKVKLLNNATFGANIGVLSVISGLARKLELDEAALLRAISHGSGNSMVAGRIAGGGSVRAFSQATAKFVDKDIQTASTLLAELGAGLDDLQPLYQAAHAIRE